MRKLLGHDHVISQGEVAVDTSKVEIMLNLGPGMSQKSGVY
jgi:hypothetical protein